MEASLLDGLSVPTTHSTARTLDVGYGYFVKINPTGPTFTSAKHRGAVMQKVGINLWLKDKWHGSPCLWHLVVIPFTMPIDWDDRAVLKFIVKLLILPADVWEKKNLRLSPQHREWLQDTEMVNEFKIGVAYTLMNKPVEATPKCSFRRRQIAAHNAAKIEQRRKKDEARQAAYAAHDVRKAEEVANDVTPAPVEPTTVQNLQREAQNHGNLLSALSGLRNVEPPAV